MAEALVDQETGRASGLSQERLTVICAHGHTEIVHPAGSEELVGDFSSFNWTAKELRALIRRKLIKCRAIGIRFKLKVLKDPRPKVAEDDVRKRITGARSHGGATGVLLWPNMPMRIQVQRKQSSLKMRGELSLLRGMVRGEMLSQVLQNSFW
jgi:hypothetical protein